MKQLKITLFLLFLSAIISKAQNTNRVSLELSTNKICFGYQLSLDKILNYSEIYVGIGNQDINKKFDDILFGIKLGSRFLSFTKSNIYGNINTGIYFPNNKYYDAVTPYIGLEMGYEIFLGKRKKHSLFTEIGYLYGQKEYIQTYTDEIIYVSSIDVFNLHPINFLVGYGFNF